jgi:hypothetical protein
LIVASVPAAHPYVAAVVDTDVVTLLDDPVPRGAMMPGQWWPPRLLEPEYVRDHVDAFDVMHVHFGFDTTARDQLAEVLDVLDARRIPLVVTVHDLQNPHFVDQAPHWDRLEILLSAAAEVITLTDGAAGEIARRWGRSATVLPHPHVLPIGAVGGARTRRVESVIAINAKHLRANVDPWPLLDTLVEHGDPGWRLRLDFDDDVLGSPRAAEVAPERLDRYRRAGVDVRVRPRLSDRGIVDYLREVDVLVMPYRHGSHSGWIEACHDAGVQAVVPDCGYFRQQRPFPVFGYGVERFDPVGFLDAVTRAVKAAAKASIVGDEHRRAHRAEQRRRVRAATDRIYRRVLRDAVAAPPQEMTA